MFEGVLCRSDGQPQLYLQHLTFRSPLLLLDFMKVVFQLLNFVCLAAEEYLIMLFSSLSQIGKSTSSLVSFKELLLALLVFALRKDINASIQFKKVELFNLFFAASTLLLTPLESFSFCKCAFFIITFLYIFKS